MRCASSNSFASNCALELSGCKGPTATVIPMMTYQQDFNEKRLTYYDALEQPLEAETFIDRLRQQMVGALSMLDEGVARNRWLTITESRKRRIRLSPLPPSRNPSTSTISSKH